MKLFERKSWSQDITCSSSTFAQNNSLKLKVCLYRKVKLYYHFTIKTLYYFYYFFLFCFVLFLCCCCFDHLYHHYSHLQSSHSQILYKIGVFKNLARKTLAQVFSYEFCKIFLQTFFYRQYPDSFTSVRKKIASAFAFQKSNMLSFRSMFLCRKILVHITKFRHT